MKQLQYPLLEADTAKAASLQLKDGYKFRLFSVGERAQTISPELMAEVLGGLVYEAQNFGKDPNTVVVVQPGGPMWGGLLSHELSKLLKIVTSQPSSSTKQTSIRLDSGFAKGRSLYFPDFLPNERVILFDDVLSSGRLAQEVVKAIRNTGAEVLGVLYIIDKFANAPDLQNHLEIPVRALVTLKQQ